MMGMLEARGATGEDAWLSNAWVSRFITYCGEHFGDLGEGGKLIQRAPRAHGQLRAAVAPERIAKYLYRLYKLMDDKKPRWVHMAPMHEYIHHPHSQTQLSYNCFLPVVLICILDLESSSLQLLFFDETGWAGFYGTDLSSVKCLAQAEYREEVTTILFQLSVAGCCHVSDQTRVRFPLFDLCFRSSARPRRSATT